MVKLIRTDSSNPDFAELVKHLDADLAEKDGDDHPFYAQFNGIDKLKYVVVAYDDSTPVGSGAIREFLPGIMEIKRMFTSAESRGKGIATRVLNELETWAAELSSDKCVLETGLKQSEAIQLYIKNGYKRVANYGPYEGIENSLCFEKKVQVDVEKLEIRKNHEQ